MRLKRFFFPLTVLLGLLLLVSCTETIDDVKKAVLLAENKLLERKLEVFEQRYEQKMVELARHKGLLHAYEELRGEYEALQLSHQQLADELQKVRLAAARNSESTKGQQQQLKAEIASLEQRLRYLSGDYGAGRPSRTPARQDAAMEVLAMPESKIVAAGDVVQAAEPVSTDDNFAAAGRLVTPGVTDSERPIAQRPLLDRALVDEISRIIENWKADWISLDADRLLGHYSSRFVTESGLNFNQWKANREAKFASSPPIEIEIRELELYREGDSGRVAAVFDQAYRSATYSDLVTKTLTLENNNGGWQIIGERTAP